MGMYFLLVKIMLLKGAPDIVIAKCSHYLGSNGETLPIDETFLAEYGAAYERYGVSIA